MAATLAIRPEDGTQFSQDYAPKDGDALTVSQLERFFTEVRDEPSWRRECDIDADYYDGHQLDADTLELMRQKGFPPIIENLCRPTIDAVLGLEAKTRTDWVVRHDHDRWEDVALALSVKMKEVERESKADKACSDAYAAMVKTGVGWVEVGKEVVPGFYPYRCRYVHRREIAFDWRYKEPDGRDMRYLIRRQWFDEDVVKSFFPKQAKLVEMIATGWAGWWDNVINDGDTGLASSYETQRASAIEQYEYTDILRKRICLYEVWYRTWKSAVMLHLPDGRWVEYDKKNKQHVKAVALGLLVPEIRPCPKVRVSFWIGPHRLIDMPSPYKHPFFPYVPFFGYREDRTGVPYGLIRSMRHQQDEVNARKAKMMWLLSAKRVRADDDSVKDHTIAKDEVARADAYIILNSARRPNSKFEVDDNLELSDQQFKVYESAKKSLQDVAGVYQQLLGKTDSGADSGVAINQLIEQGTTTLAEINDNYRHSRRQVGELLLELVKEDITNGTTVMVGEGQQRREVTLNEAANDEFGPYLKNDVQRAGVKVVLDDIPSTPTYRQQQLAYLTEITKSLPPNIQGIVVDFIIEATDLPNRRAIAERVRTFLGVNSDKPPRTPEEAQAQKEKQAAAARAADRAERAQEAEVQGLEGKALESHAKAAKTMAEAQGAGAEDAARAEEAEQRAGQLEDELKQVVAEAQKTIQDLQKELESALEDVKAATDAQQQAEAEVRRIQLEARISEQFNKLNQRVEKVAGDLKVARASKPAAKQPAKGAAK